jgi:predicted dehydrogenase
MAKTLCVGVIGAGGISRGHIKAFRALPAAEVVALADPSEEMIERVKEAVDDKKWKPKVYKDHKTMLAKAELEAVLIASPHTFHYDQALDALDAGCHLMMEKPMVCKAAHAKDMIARARKAKRVILVSYQRHYSPLYIEARKVIRRGQIGHLTAICGYLAQCYYPYVVNAWRGDPDLAGEAGQFNDSGSHLVAAMLWCSDLSPEEVFTYGENGPAKVNMNSATTVRFDNGCLGSLSINGHVTDGFAEELIFWGSEGSLHIKNGQLFRGRRGEPITPVEKLPAPKNRHEEFQNAIRGKGRITSGGDIGLRVAELTEAAFTSVKTGRPCTVAEL